MRAVDPAPPAARRPVRATGVWATLKLDRAGLVDAVALVAAMMVALAGFSTTFDSWRFLAVAAGGVLIGWLTSHLVLSWGWHWLVAVALIPLDYFLFAGPIALRRDLVAGALPSGRTELDLAHLAVGGWKEVLTTLPPLAGDSEYLVLPFLLGLVLTALGAVVAGRTRSPRSVLICPGLTLALVILLGSTAPAGAVWQGLATAAILIAWVQTRSGRHDRLAGTGAPRLSRVVSGVLMAALALGGAYFLAPRLPGHDSHVRLVLRTYVQPPIEIRQYASPLAAYRKYSSDSDASPLYDQILLRVSGGQAGDYLRIAVLDDYNGLVWSAAQGTGFQRVGSRLPARGDPRQLTIAFEGDYAGQIELANWVPGLGSATAVDFSGPNARSHQANFFYDLSKGQGLVFDGLRADDEVEVVSVPVPLRQKDETLSPGSGPALVPDEQTEFMADKLRSLTIGATTPWERLMKVAQAFTQGAWSDGSKDSEMYYLPGHSRGRLTTFIQVPDTRFIGSEEHYVAAFALAANRLGIPARVVFGAVLPADGVVRGRDITPWVEVWTTNGWVAVPPEDYVAPRDRPPDQLPPIEPTDPTSVYVPPPNPQPQPPRNDNVIDTRAKVAPPVDPDLLPDSLVLRVVIFSSAGLAGLGLLLGLVLALKLARRRVRRGRGSSARRIQAGWYEALDRVRDLGRSLPAQGTRLELAHRLALAPLTGLARATDRAMFSAQPPDQATVQAYWDQVKRTRRELLAEVGPRRRWWALVNPRSLLPLSKAARGLLGAPPDWEAIRPHQAAVGPDRPIGQPAAWAGSEPVPFDLLDRSGAPDGFDWSAQPEPGPAGPLEPVWLSQPSDPSGPSDSSGTSEPVALVQPEADLTRPRPPAAVPDGPIVQPGRSEPGPPDPDAVGDGATVRRSQLDPGPTDPAAARDDSTVRRPRLGID
ncbi:MAG: transglutaminaseTgpA domain-containing protein [Propionibacteriaceae bacterium]|jgi:MFS family permease|nr:transglutaminaseTgpA domain-containing protein [Propionibacteriaceae bacterium]